jgi:hypothetical protein
MLPAHHHVTALAALAMLVVVPGFSGGCAAAEDRSKGVTEAVAASDVDATAASTLAAPADTDTGAPADGTTDPSGTGSGTVAAATAPEDVTTTEAPVADAAEQLESLQDALGTGDACKVYDALAHVDLDSAGGKEFAQQVTSIADVMEEAEKLVAPALQDDWKALVDGAREMATELRRHPDERQRAASVFADPDLMAADERVETWMDTNCA